MTQPLTPSTPTPPAAPSTPPPARRPRGPHAARAAFTLLEVLIAVGALGLIALGISQVFRATGETVKAGRRLSNMNTFAALVETQLRRDFSQITRDGFLMIRNERVDGDTPFTGVLLYDGQPDTVNNRRPRRVDELVFFTTGDFVTLRPAVHPSRIARAEAARVYIGHGLRGDPRAPGYTNRVRLEYKSQSPPIPGTPAPPRTFGRRNTNPATKSPNLFAADWILMRHVTLLTRPSEVAPPPVTAPISPTLLPVAKQRDNQYQVALQPAVRSIFRDFSENAGVFPQNSQLALRPPDPNGERWRFDCGAVDIATTDLTEIRAFLTAVTNRDPAYRQTPPVANQRTFFDAFGPTGTWSAAHTTDPNTDPAIQIQQWMINSLPVNSDYPLANAGNPIGGRMRVEPKPPNPMGYGVSFNGSDLHREMDRASQMMLASSVFVPGCSEFIVEWSFGQRYTDPPPNGVPAALAGELIWYGMERAVDREDAFPNPSDPRMLEAVVPYRSAGAGAIAYEQPYYKLDGTVDTWPVDGTLIHDAISLAGTQRRAYSFFGYTNPTFNSADPDDPLTIPWPWPKLIRITMTLVDPSEPSFEQTYQFIFDLPPDPVDSAS